MQIYNVSKGVKGFVRLANYALRWAIMVTKHAKHKARVLAFWQKHGIKPTIEAFQVKERTLYLWKSQQKKGGGKLEALNERSKRPIHVRKREWSYLVKQEIRRLRTDHPNLGKDKIYPLLSKFCKEQGLNSPSISTIGNLIHDAGGLRTFPVKVRHDGTIVRRKREKKARKPKNFIASYPGHCVALDTIERTVHGSRRYIISFIDLYSRFGFALATNSHASSAAKTFFDYVRLAFPFRIDHVLTDNGSEFMKVFAAELKRLHLVHWHTYPRQPKMNPHNERFNRTIQEEFVDYHIPLLLDIQRFNTKMLEWLIWYNTERPHFAHGQIPPLRFITINAPENCNMYLTHTHD